jgi:hypothetical protein
MKNQNNLSGLKQRNNLVAELSFGLAAYRLNISTSDEVRAKATKT